MAASTISGTVAFIYKRRYSGPVGQSAMREHSLLSTMTKKDGFTGVTGHYAIRYVNPQGISVGFSTAQSSVTGSSGVQLSVSRKKRYGYITLDGESMAAAEDDPGAFLRLVTTETDGIIDEVVDDCSFDLFRDGYGVRGQRGSINTNTITLATSDDARNFKVGMTVRSGPNTDGTSLNTGTTTVSSVDEDAGTVTVASAAAMSGFSDNHYLWRAGDTGYNSCEGLAALFPLAAPSTSESFRGIDRSVDPSRLAGSRLDDTSGLAEENLRRLAVKISQRNKKASLAVLNPVKFDEVARRLDAKVSYTDAGGEAASGFESFYLATPAGRMKVISDAHCPTNRGYALNMSTLYIWHLKGFPHIIEDDGRPSSRLSSEDSIEKRVRVMWNLICTDPSSNGVTSIG